MIELIDNAIQLTVTILCGAAAGYLAATRRKQAYGILLCYYCVLSLGNLYWLVYDILTTYTPQIFYVSDLCWMASYMFLLMLVAGTD